MSDFEAIYNAVRAVIDLSLEPAARSFLNLLTNEEDDAKLTEAVADEQNSGPALHDVLIKAQSSGDEKREQAANDLVRHAWEKLSTLKGPSWQPSGSWQKLMLEYQRRNSTPIGIDPAASLEAIRKEFERLLNQLPEKNLITVSHQPFQLYGSFPLLGNSFFTPTYNPINGDIVLIFVLDRERDNAITLIIPKQLGPYHVRSFLPHTREHLLLLQALQILRNPPPRVQPVDELFPSLSLLKHSDYDQDRLIKESVAAKTIEEIERGITTGQTSLMQVIDYLTDLQQQVNDEGKVAYIEYQIIGPLTDWPQEDPLKLKDLSDVEVLYQREFKLGKFSLEQLEALKKKDTPFLGQSSAQNQPIRRAAIRHQVQSQKLAGNHLRPVSAWHEFARNQSIGNRIFRETSQATAKKAQLPHPKKKANPRTHATAVNHSAKARSRKRMGKALRRQIGMFGKVR